MGLAAGFDKNAEIFQHARLDNPISHSKGTKMIRLIALLVGLCAALPVATPVAAQDKPLVRFGAIADPQYAPAAPRGTRYYANSLWKLSEAIEKLNGENLDFVVTLGDIIDRDTGAVFDNSCIEDALVSHKPLAVLVEDRVSILEPLGDVVR